MPTHICGAGLAFLGFAVSLIIGLYVNNSFTTVVLRALAVLVVFYLLGVTLAALAQRAVQENFDNEINAAKKKAQNAAELVRAQAQAETTQPDQTIKEPTPA